MDEHRVRNQSWKVTTSSAEDAFAWRTFLHREGEGLLSPLLEEVFKECGVGERELHVGSLRVQVTVDSPGQLAEVLPTAIRREILQKLHLTDQGGTLQSDTDAAREPEKGGFDRLLGYLERGTLPWEWQHLPAQEAAGRLAEASILHFEYIVAHLQQVREEAPFWSRLLQLLPMPLRRELLPRVSGPPAGVEQLWTDSGVIRSGEGEDTQGADGHPGGDDHQWARQGEPACPEGLSSNTGSAAPETAPRGETSAVPLPKSGAAGKRQAMQGSGTMTAQGAEPGEDAGSVSPPLHFGQGETVPPGQQQEEPSRLAYSAALFPGETPARAEEREIEGNMPQRQNIRRQDSASGYGSPEEAGTWPKKGSTRGMAHGEEPSAQGAAGGLKGRETCLADPTGAVGSPLVPEVTKGQASGEVALQEARETPGKGRKQPVGPAGMVVAAGPLTQGADTQIPPEGVADLEVTKRKGSPPPASDWADGAGATDYHHKGNGGEERPVGLRQVLAGPLAAQGGEIEEHEQATASPAAMAPGPPAAAPSRQGRAQTYPLLVHQGGVILLHPFMVRFLGHCGVLDAEGKKVAQGCAARAAVLLHYLCTGRDELFEFELGLEKVLLGLAPDAPLPNCRELLGEEDRLQAENLLQSAIGHWSALKNTSVEGFRSSFLQRPALLREEGECWRLQVERKAYDLLLDHLPWSISIVRLPWMTKPLHTEW